MNPAPAPHLLKPPVAAERWARIRLFAMDVDGVLTDGSVLVFSDGLEAKSFSLLDGYGLARARDHGIALAWISGRKSDVTTRRAAELKIPHLVQGRHDKALALEELMARLGVQAGEVCYMGDDDIDVEAIKRAGVGATVATGSAAALAAADFVARRPAGRGAVREVCDLILRARGRQDRPADPGEGAAP